MQSYLNTLKRLREEGVYSVDRTGVGTYSLFGIMERYDLQEGFPLLTTKRISFHGVKHELLWYLQGTGNTKYLEDNNVTIWREWQDEQGNLGPVYGVQWRHWQTPYGTYIDQIENLIEGLKTNPYGRRHIVTAWNPSDLDRMALPPCHMMAQFYVREGKLSCLLTQRSCDYFLGKPWNIACYALLTHMIAQVCGLEVGELVHSMADTHIYSNHLEAIDTQLQRTPHSLPTLHLDPSITHIDDFRGRHIQIQDYEHEPSIWAPVAV